jgi:hypothetical protein
MPRRPYQPPPPPPPQYPFEPEFYGEPCGPCGDYRNTFPTFSQQVPYPWAPPPFPWAPPPPPQPVGVEPPLTPFPIYSFIETPWHKIALAALVALIQQGKPIEEAVAGATQAANTLLAAERVLVPGSGQAPQPVK